MKKKKQPSFWEEFIPTSWTFLKNYSFSLFKSDLIAGVTVGVVALPLAMAFAIAAGLPPERGLYTAIIAGFLTSLLGGTRLQIGGPTGAFVVIIYDIVLRSGYEGLVSVTLLASIILLIAAFSRLGTLIKYIPYPLITGFTSGIATLIFFSQIKDFLGLKIQGMPADFIPKCKALFVALPTFDPTTFAVALSTLGLIILIRKFLPSIPWGIASVVIITSITFIFDIPVDTLATRFGIIPRTLPTPSFSFFSFSFESLQLYLPDAIVVAFLAGMESLLCAVVADGMAGTKHKSNCELMAQGIANMGSVVFGGIPATGAIARTATNIKTGAKTPVAGMIHALTLLAIMLCLSPLVSQISLSALSAILIMVAWNMSEMQHFRHLFKAPLSDIIVLLTTFLLTVFVDLTVAVEVGMILALFLFMKKMTETSHVVPLIATEKPSRGKTEEYELDHLSRKEIPSGIEVYEITGPFFFGVVDRLANTLSNVERPPKVFILRLRKVPVIDASGMHALREFYTRCKKQKTQLLFSGVSPSLYTLLKKFGLVDLVGEKQIFSHLDIALSHAQKELETTK